MSELKTFEPEAVFEEISACPPLMRDEARAAYVGQEVDWMLIFIDGWEESPGFARLAFRQERSIVRCVFATVPLVDCPWLKSMRAGETMRLRGRISEVNAVTIDIEGASVSQVVEAAH